MGQARDLTDAMLTRATPGRAKGSYRELWDLREPGLYCRIGKRAKVWWHRIGTGRPRTRIGQYPRVTIPEARGRARSLRGHEEKLQQGLPSSHPLAPTLEEAIEEFERAGRPSHDGEGTLKPTTWLVYQSVLRTVFKELYDQRMSAITKRVVEDAMEHSGYAATTAKRACRALRTIAAFAVRKKWISEDPTAGLKTSSKTKNPYRVLQADEVRDTLQKMLDGPPDVRSSVFLLALASCVRPSMLYRLAPENFQEEDVVEWKPEQMKMSNTCIWFPGPRLRPLVARLARLGRPFYQGSDRSTTSWLYSYYKCLGVQAHFKSAQKTGNTWMQEEATRQKESDSGIGATMSDIPYAGRLMTAHTPSDMTEKTYTGRIYRVNRPLLEKAAVVLEDRIAEVVGVDLTDKAVLDVLCPLG